MSGGKTGSDAASILHRRYVKGDPAREASIEEERVNARVATMIYCLRTEANSTQKELADLVGTKQSAISRLEDADYEGHSLSMLNRIAEALKRRLVVEMAAADPRPSDSNSETAGRGNNHATRRPRIGSWSQGLSTRTGANGMTKS